MTGIGSKTKEIICEDEGLRLDRWFKRRFPQIANSQLQKWLRTGQVRVDGKRAKAGSRLAAGQRIRVPPFAVLSSRGQASGGAEKIKISAADEADLRSRILYRDDRVIVLDKPPGLAVQGGTKTPRHLDGMLDALRFGHAERPRLVHRLDKETSGVLVLARDAGAAAKLAAAFRQKRARKLYWAAVAGSPRQPFGRIGLALAKRRGPKGERMAAGESEGKGALTIYKVLDRAPNKASWLALLPLTGRTHQLRAHCAALGAPILGDAKYGGACAFLRMSGLPRKLHLHARAIRIPHPDGTILQAVAPMPGHMQETWRLLGFTDSERDEDDPFAGFDYYFEV